MPDRCTSCRSALASEYWTVGERTLCARCYDREYRCAVCGQLLRARFLQLAASRVLVHEQCLQRCLRCATCGSHETPSQVHTLPDGRCQCTTCAADAVWSVRELEGLWQPARRWVERLTGFRLKTSIALRIVSPAEIDKAAGRSTHVSTKRPIGLFLQQGPDFQILVESAHPREDVLQVLVHEYGHALLTERNAQVSQIENEGFARWLEYRYLCAHGRSEKAETLRSDSSIYGRGLNQMLERERKSGGRLIIRCLQ